MDSSFTNIRLSTQRHSSEVTVRRRHVYPFLYMDKFYSLTALVAVHLVRLIGAAAAMLILSILLYLVEAL